MPFLTFVRWRRGLCRSPWGPAEWRSGVGDRLSPACTKFDHPQLDQLFQILFKGSAFTGGMPYKLVIGAVPRVTNKVDWLRISGWSNPSVPEEDPVEGFDIGLLKSFGRGSLSLELARVRRG